MALTGLLLGIVTVMFAMLPVVGWWVAVVPGILALIFGIVGVHDACRSDGTGAVRAAIAILLSLSPFPVSLGMASFYGSI
jgi:Na+/H+ antiporter NhaD/arsenite permease-like protein